MRFIQRRASAGIRAHAEMLPVRVAADQLGDAPHLVLDQREQVDAVGAAGVDLQVDGRGALGDGGRDVGGREFAVDVDGSVAVGGAVVAVGAGLGDGVDLEVECVAVQEWEAFGVQLVAGGEYGWVELWWVLGEVEGEAGVAFGVVKEGAEDDLADFVWQGEKIGGVHASGHARWLRGWRRSSLIPEVDRMTSRNRSHAPQRVLLTAGAKHSMRHAMRQRCMLAGP